MFKGRRVGNKIVHDVLGEIEAEECLYHGRRVSREEWERLMAEEERVCFHCKESRAPADMSKLSSGQISRMCNKCWSEFVGRHPVFGR